MVRRAKLLVGEPRAVVRDREHGRAVLCGEARADDGVISACRGVCGVLEKIADEKLHLERVGEDRDAGLDAPGDLESARGAELCDRLFGKVRERRRHGLGGLSCEASDVVDDVRGLRALGVDLGEYGPEDLGVVEPPWAMVRERPRA